MVMLRNPVDRAYSNFLYQRKFGREPLSDFGQAFAQEASRIRQNWNPFWYYKQNGYYYIPVNRYLDTFGPNQFKIFLYDDWNAKNLATLKAIFQFLEVDETFIPNIASRQNRASMPRSLLMAGFLHQRNALRTALEAIGKKLLPKRSRFAIFRLLEKANHRQPPRLDPDLRAQLIQEYRDDILRLQDLIQRDLSIWLE
jgi:hypothetical protein